MADQTVPEAPSVKVTLGRIYETVQEIDKKLDPIPGQVRDHEQRIRTLERQVWLWVGGASVGGGGIVALITRAIGG